MTSLIESLLDDLDEDTTMSPERRELLRDLLERVVMVAQADAATKDLRVAVTAVDELLEAFTLFQHWRDRKKMTIFGSARTRVDSPLFEMTRELARAMAERDWIIVSGAGPGIMEASVDGRGQGKHPRGQYRAAVRAERQRLHRRQDQSRDDELLLHPQGGPHPALHRLRGAARRTGHHGRALRGPHAARHRQDDSRARSAARHARRRVLAPSG